MDAQPQRTWGEWFGSFWTPSQPAPPPMNGTISTADGVQGGRKKKTRRGGKKSRKSKSLKPRRK